MTITRRKKKDLKIRFLKYGTAGTPVFPYSRTLIIYIIYIYSKNVI